MIETTQNPTAEIYSFPTDRRTQSGPKIEDMVLPDARLSPVVFGTGWYHDEAIAEARPTASVVMFRKS